MKCHWCVVDTALFARALSACNIKDLINNVGSAAAAPAAAAGTGAAPVDDAKKDEKKEEEKKEETDSEDEDMGFGKCSGSTHAIQLCSS